MDNAQFGQFSEIDFNQFLLKSKEIKCRVIGLITSITKHRKFIIEVLLNKKQVIRCYKRFTQFQTLYEKIKKQFSGYEIEEFPSRYQIFGKDETRKYYFQNLLNQIIKDYAKQNPQVSQQLVMLVFNFLTQHIKKQKIRKQMIIKNKLKQRKNQTNNVGLSMETDAMSQNGKKVIKKNFQDHFQSQKQQTNKQKSLCSSVDLTSPSILITRGRSNSMHQTPSSPLAPKDVLSNILAYNTKKIDYIYDNQFQIKFANQDEWKIGFIDVKDSNLLLYKNKLDSHFKTCIQLYRIQVEYLKRDKNIIDYFCDQIQYPLTRTFNQDQTTLCLFHQYDHNKILIRKPSKNNQEDQQKNKFSLSKLRDYIIAASHISPIYPNYNGVFFPIGKMFVFIHKLNCNWTKYSENVWIRIKTGAMTYFTMPMTCNGDAQINQGFLIPISNTFERIKLQCYVAKDKKDKGSLIGYFTFNMVEFFAKPQKSLVQKLQVNLQTSEKSNEQPAKLQISLQNLSDFSSIYSNSFGNQHDGVPLKAISSLDNIDDFNLSLNRIKCIIGNINLFIRAFKRNVVKFKYPYLAYIFWSFIFINVAFVDITYILRQIIAFVLLSIIYQQKHVYLIVNYIMNKYVFSNIHQNFKKPQILSTGQVTDLKWSHQLRYIAEDYYYKDGQLQKKNDIKRDVYKFIVHQRQFLIKEEEQTFFQKLKEVKNILEMVYKIVNSLAFSLQKISNLFTWVDYRKTIFISMILLILTGLASGITVRIIICSVCVAKLVAGPAYYRSKLYARNRKFAVYSLRYILQKSFSEIIGNKNIHKNMSYIQLNQYISNISFPINDQQSTIKLKQEMSRVMGIYLQPESLYPKVLKLNNLKLVHLIDMIQTCQQKLNLKFIAGEEGISDQFQQLKQQNKQTSQFDEWVAQAISNFVLNIPSKLFLIFHKNQLNKIEKAENIQAQEIEKQEKSQNSQNNFKTQTINFENPNLKPEPIPVPELVKNTKKIDNKVREVQAAKQKMLITKQASQQI